MKSLQIVFVLHNIFMIGGASQFEQLQFLKLVGCGIY